MTIFFLLSLIFCYSDHSDLKLTVELETFYGFESHINIDSINNAVESEKEQKVFGDKGAI